MELIATKGDRKVWLMNYNETPLSFPFEGEPFVCVIWNNKEGYSSKSLAKEIIKANCKYFLAGGVNCHQWELLADLAYIDQFPEETRTKDDHAMTTAHENEPLEEVLWFALMNTNFDYHDFKDFLVVQIGDKYSKESMQKIADSVNV